MGRKKKVTKEENKKIVFEIKDLKKAKSKKDIHVKRDNKVFT